MSKKKHKQNQSVISDETKNNVVSDSQQNATQPDATNPQEHGRSMTEMLGVLAVLGVLSIGGVQGYRYAMNKYHSNEVINELNLLNAQLAVFMNGIHDDEAVMSLGEPYDDGRRINTGGYAFDYGCGQDPDSNSPCDLDETGYFMILDGVPEDVCKSASQMTAHMMNLVEQKVNGHTDIDGVLCQDGDNQLTFLFDANDGQGFENGNGDDNDEGNATNPNNPAVTLPKEEEETTTTTTFETTTTTPIVTQTGTGTSNCGTNEILVDYCNGCGDWNDNQVCATPKRSNGYSSPYGGTWYQVYANTNAFPDYESGEAICRSFGLRLPSLSVLVHNATTNWDSYSKSFELKNIATDLYNHFRTPLIFTSDRTSTSRIILSLTNNNTGHATFNAGYAHDDYRGCNGCYKGAFLCYEGSINRDEAETTTPYETTTATYSMGAECSNNSDCTSLYGSGYYCDIPYYTSGNTCTKDTSDKRGNCRNAQTDLRTKPASAPFWVSKGGMTWWSANNFCQAIGKTLVLLSDYGCSASEGNCNSATVKAMKTAYTSYSYGWTNTDRTSCTGYSIHFGDERVISTSLYCGAWCAVCK